MGRLGGCCSGSTGSNTGWQTHRPLGWEPAGRAERGGAGGGVEADTLQSHSARTSEGEGPDSCITISSNLPGDSMSPRPGDQSATPSRRGSLIGRAYRLAQNSAFLNWQQKQAFLLTRVIEAEGTT